MSKSLKRVRAALEDLGLVADIREMPGETRTAQQAAEAAGCALDQIAKSIIFRGQDSGTAILFLTAGGNQVDAGKASAVAGEALGKADANLIRAQTGFAIGGVAPVGHLTLNIAVTGRGSKTLEDLGWRFVNKGVETVGRDVGGFGGIFAQTPKMAV